MLFKSKYFNKKGQEKQTEETTNMDSGQIG
jgi:hypothetical protein